jgi:hypothetical protein
MMDFAATACMALATLLLGLGFTYILAHVLFGMSFNRANRMVITCLAMSGLAICVVIALAVIKGVA